MAADVIKVLSVAEGIEAFDSFGGGGGIKVRLFGWFPALGGGLPGAEVGTMVVNARE